MKKLQNERLRFMGFAILSLMCIVFAAYVLKDEQSKIVWLSIGVASGVFIIYSWYAIIHLTAKFYNGDPEIFREFLETRNGKDYVKWFFDECHDDVMTEKVRENINSLHNELMAMNDLFEQNRLWVNVNDKIPDDITADVLLFDSSSGIISIGRLSDHMDNVNITHWMHLPYPAHIWIRNGK